MLSVLARIIGIAMVALGAAIATAVHSGKLVWLDDVQSVSLAFDCLLVVVFFPALGIYQSWRGKPLYDLLCRVSGGWVMVEITGILISFSLHRSDSLSRLWLFYWAIATIVLLIVTKVIVYSILRGLRREGFNQRAVAIVGGAPYGRFLIEQMRSRPEAGFSPVVVFDEEGTINPYEDPDASDAIEGVPVERDYTRMLQLVSSPGPVFFRQKRKGIDGNQFEIYKFRSMKMHKEEAGKITQATKRDPRITAVGAFLRRTSLDELPQFINVLRGEMSVVGPRPHALEHDDIYKDLVKGYMHRYRIKPGITGWAQINGYRGETDRIEKMMGRVKLDLYYMQHWTFWLDIKIVVLTLWKGFVGSNAY